MMTVKNDDETSDSGPNVCASNRNGGPTASGNAKVNRRRR